MDSSSYGSEAHSEDHHDHDHDHSHDGSGPDRGQENSLYPYIDINKVVCYNERVPNSVKSIFKPWEHRLDELNLVESDIDEQLLIYIPFTGQVKLKTIALKCAPDASAPSTMKVFINQDTLDFDTADTMVPIQTWPLLHPSDVPNEPVPYPTKLTKFNAVRNLTLYFPSNHGALTTKLFYLGFQGEFFAVNQDPIITLYEAAANPSDHVPFHRVSETQATRFSN
ncbi:hypothetical protein HMI54_015642 [Coelomomyces lativittatus]|nr:hypothetical protein HMI56_007434 [Coelomomyces lativittatus]KAJ1508365.1 hypothetical protein HMI55_000404 [Coelomomyces lativittatus]KAJ1518500.1 hypothetical protein HMI54_015642 [Coelomomyces lativittatus]